METAIPPPPRPQPRRAGRRRTVLLVALGLLVALAILALTPMLARPPADGDRNSAAGPAGGSTVGPAATAPTGAPVVQATEVTAPPARKEPTDVVRSGAAGSPPAVPGTAGPGTPTSTAPPTPTVQPAPFAVEITCAQAENNVSGQVCVHTAPGAALTITVTYCSGREARNIDLQGKRYADNEGNYMWTWVPETTCPGTAVAHVRASAPGGSASATATFPVP